MTSQNDFNLFVGGKTGAFKGVKVDGKGVLVKNLQNVKILKPENEITVLRWDDDNECNILMGTVDQQVKVYDIDFKAYSTCIETKFGTGPIVGITRCNGAILTCSESGHVRIWKYKKSEQTDLAVGDAVNCMQSVSHRPEIIATGGKNNDLKLWNVETKTKVFHAKNVKKDMLELEVPIWVSDVKYIPNTEHQIAVSTKYGQIRLYDTRTQRRPVIDVQLTNQSLNTLTLCADNNRIITGSSTGFILSVDTRGKGKVLHSYKGAVGSIRQVVASADEPYVASVGLDRYLRIHHLETRKLLHQQYLKVRLNCVLMRSSFGKPEEEEEEDNKSEDNSTDKDVECIDLEASDNEYDDIFGKMETVGERRGGSKAKKRKIAK